MHIKHNIVITDCYDNFQFDQPNHRLIHIAIRFNKSVVFTMPLDIPITVILPLDLINQLHLQCYEI